MIIIQTFTMARWQIVVKTSEATKQTKDQTDNKKQTNKRKQKQQQQNGRRRRGLKKQITKRMMLRYCSAIFFCSGISRTAHLQKLSKVDVDHRKKRSIHQESSISNSESQERPSTPYILTLHFWVNPLMVSVTNPPPVRKRLCTHRLERCL